MIFLFILQDTSSFYIFSISQIFTNDDGWIIS